MIERSVGDWWTGNSRLEVGGCTVYYDVVSTPNWLITNCAADNEVTVLTILIIGSNRRQ